MKPRQAWLAITAIGIFLGATVPRTGFSQRRYASFSGTSFTVGSLRLSGGRVTPCEREVRKNPETQTDDGAPVQVQPPPDDQKARELQQAKAFYEQGFSAFMNARWAEAIGLLKQALALAPDDPAVLKTLAAAQIGLRCEQLQDKALEDAQRLIDEDNARVAQGLGRLLDSLDTLRQEALGSLIDRGGFEAAVNLSTHTDFLYDSSVVDLREARQGVVNFDVLKPPPSSRAGNVDFPPPSPPAALPLPPVLRRAEQLLQNPALEAVMFFERMGEAIGLKNSVQETENRLADPVTRAVADTMGVDIAAASPAQKALIRKKTREIWQSYDRQNALRDRKNAAIAQNSIRSFKAMLNKWRADGILGPDENVLSREKSDASFRARMKSGVQGIVQEEDRRRRETVRDSFDKLLADVSAIIDGKPQR